MTTDFEEFSIPDFIHYIYFPILILEKEPVFSFFMLSAKRGNYWYHFYNVFGMTRSVTRGIEPGTSRTLPLGNRGGGEFDLIIYLNWTISSLRTDLNNYSFT